MSYQPDPSYPLYIQPESKASSQPLAFTHRCRPPDFTKTIQASLSAIHKMPKRTSPRQSFPVSPRSARLGSASPDFSDTPEAAEITRLVQMLNIDGTTQNPFEGTQTANTSANGNRLSAHRSRQWGRVLPGVCIRGHLRENESSRAPSPESLRRARPYDRLTQATHPYAFVGRPSARFNNPVRRF